MAPRVFHGAGGFRVSLSPFFLLPFCPRGRHHFSSVIADNCLACRQPVHLVLVTQINLHILGIPQNAYPLLLSPDCVLEYRTNVLVFRVLPARPAIAGSEPQALRAA